MLRSKKSYWIGSQPVYSFKHINSKVSKGALRELVQTNNRWIKFSIKNYTKFFGLFLVFICINQPYLIKVYLLTDMYSSSPLAVILLYVIFTDETGLTAKFLEGI